MKDRIGWHFDWGSYKLLPQSATSKLMLCENTVTRPLGLLDMQLGSIL